MSVATLPGMAPPPIRPHPLTAEDGPPRYRTVRDVRLLDQHSPIQKTTLDGGRIQKQRLGVTAGDLATLARNSNRAVMRGTPPALQIGHNPFDEDIPESALPRPVGYSDNYHVANLDGGPFLVADLHILESEFDDALTYPRISIERVAWSDPSVHQVKAVALIRRPPERDLPTLPYAAAAGFGRQVACYARDLDIGSTPEAPEQRRQRLAWLGATGLTGQAAKLAWSEHVGQAAHYAARAGQGVAAFEPGRPAVPYDRWLQGVGLKDDPSSRLSYRRVQEALRANPGDPFASYRRASAADRSRFLSWCGSNGLRASDPKARQLFERALADGDA